MASTDSRRAGLPPGRTLEAQRIESVIKRADQAVPQFLAIEGDPGIGKTTLINHLISSTPDWQHHVIELDPSDASLPGAVLKRLLVSLSGDRGLILADSTEQLVQQLLDTIDALEDRICVVLEDVQWVDTLSAEVLWRGARELSVGRFLLVMSCRAFESRNFQSRFRRFLTSVQRVEHLSLSPLSVDGVREALMANLETPVSNRVARAVHEATSGIPLLLNTVTEWLAHAPSSQRNLSAALAALHDTHDGPRRIFNQALLASLDPLSDAQRFAVSLLAVSGDFIRTGTMQQILAEEGHDETSIESLQLPGLTKIRADSADLGIIHPGLAPLITQQLPVHRRAHLHTVLAHHSQGEDALGHRAMAQQLVPDPEQVLALLTELMQAGDTALVAGHPYEAFRYFQWATWFSTEPRALTMAIRSATLAGPADLLPQLSALLEQAPKTRAVSAAKAQLLLAEGDLVEALTGITYGLSLPEPDDDFAGTITLASALAAAGRLAYATARFGATAAAIETTLTQLEEIRTSLQATTHQNARSASLIPEVISLQALLRLWAGLRHRDPNRMREFGAEMRSVVAELEGLSGTQAVVRTINGVLGTVARQHEDLPTAYVLLRSAYDGGSETNEFTVHAATHLGLIAFHSGQWDEAQKMFTWAIEDSLLLPEDAGALLAYAAAALIPMGRGELTEGVSLLRRVEDQASQRGLVDIAAMFARAIGAFMAHEHEQAVRAFNAIDEAPYGWAYVGFSYMTLYARVLMLTGRAGLIAQLQRRLEHEAHSIPGPIHTAIKLGLNSATDWAAGDPVRAYQHLDQCLEILDSLPPVVPGAHSNPGGGYSLFRAIAALHLGQIVVNTPELAEHRGLTSRRVQEAGTVFLRCGVLAFHQESLELVTLLSRMPEAAEPGSPVTRPIEPASGPERELAYRHLAALTSRERQIALEVAQGKNNKEIATQLFLSVRTVEYHVANCLAKLSLPSRVELRGALRPALEVRVAHPQTPR